MTIWLRVRRARSLIGWSVVVSALLLAVGATEVPIPSVVEFTSVTWPFALILPAILAIAIGYALDGGDGQLEEVAARRLHLFDVCLVSMVTVTSMAASVALHSVGWVPVGVDAARNTLGYVGLTLTARWVLGGGAGAVVTPAYVLLVVFFGGPSRDQAAWWAWATRSIDDPVATAQALGWFMVGSLLTLLPGRRLVAIDFE